MSNSQFVDQDARNGSDRRHEILKKAARLFVAKGFDATSIRDIASASGILSGSLYHHFASKEEIFVAVHEVGIDSLVKSLQSATKGVADPWDRLAAAAAAHCEAVLESADFMVLVVPKFPASMGPFRDVLVRQRDRYERLVGELVEALDLPADVDRRVFRLHYLGALNWTQSWFRTNGKIKPAAIGHQLVRMLRPRTSQTLKRGKKK